VTDTLDPPVPPVSGPPAGGGDRVEPVDIQQEMQRSYIDYAMSVIVGRALPLVEDGLKPVHRRVLYSMGENGFRPDRSYVKCARVVGEVMGNYHPHGDSSIYDALVRLAQPWSMRYPLIDGQGNFGSRGNDPAAAMRYTECRLSPLAMAMLQDIDEDTVNFTANYDGKTQEPDVLPSRVPNLLINGSSGIAVGMATNIPPHNLREVGAGVVWALEHPEASRGGGARRADGAHQGPGLPDRRPDRRPGRDRAGLPHGPRVGADARRRRGRGRRQGPHDPRRHRACPTRSTRTTSSSRSPGWCRDGKLAGIAEINDESSDRIGMRIVVTLKRDAVAKVVLNNLYKHTQLQYGFGVNMLAIVDGVPRTLRLDQVVRNYIRHQIEVIVRRTRYRLRKAEERAHILRGYVKALDALDEVIALIRASATVDVARRA
jgi:DNA gyrase subunit A